MQTLNGIDLSFLDSLRQQILDSTFSVEEAHQTLVAHLFQIWKETPSEVWVTLRKKIAQHPIKDLLYQDPFTQRCFEKPRGYAGDAIMLDYIYGCSYPEHMTEFGKAIFDHNMISYPSIASVRYRCRLMSDIIDSTWMWKRSARILAVACGHLREIQFSKAASKGCLGEFIAFDQDPDSLQLVHHELSVTGITTVQGNVKDLVKGQHKWNNLDLIYSAGLYDYLPQSFAQQLTASLFSMLGKGGMIIVPNFLPGIPDIGYMETFMDWILIYRDLETLTQVAAAIPPDQIASMTTFVDPYKNLGFLEITKR
jgi:extracellular factor (EF) 3-hydroxypalmitic acid methyl ester biosynthesis protein